LQGLNQQEVPYHQNQKFRYTSQQLFM